MPARADTAAGLNDLRNGRYAEAIVELKEAADAGDATAALFLGVMSDTGQGVPQNYSHALSWYRRAAQTGSPSAMFNVGIMYDSGKGVQRDETEAAWWYGQAAAKGFPRAEYNLGLMYEDGSGVPRNRSRAIEMFRLAALHGIAAAGTHLASLGSASVATRARHPQAPAPASDEMVEFRKGQAGMLSRTPAEEASAVVLLHRTDRRGGTMAQSAQYDLGFCYENGIGVPRDSARAYGWYVKSMASGGDARVSAVAASGARNLEAHLTPDERRVGLSQAASGI